MYHYLKWAAVSLFFRRNLRYLVLIAVGFVGIYLVDAVYQDMADFAARRGEPEAIGTYLLIKWTAVAGLGGVILFSITRLGFGGGRGEKKREKNPPKRSKTPLPSAEEDPIMKRLEKFKEPGRLRRRSDLVIAQKRRRGR